VLGHALPFWRNSSVKKKRLYAFLFVFVLSIVVTFAGTLVPLTDEEANLLSDKVNQTLSENGTLASLSVAIFVNNFSICLLMFIPVVGAAFGVFVLFSTGMSISALSMVQGISPIFALLALMLTPIFWIEFVAYSWGMSESIWLFRRLSQKRWWHIAWTIMFIGVTAALLAIGAVVEAWLILL